jgi:sulfonate transport system substrate-binding protein
MNRRQLLLGFLGAAAFAGLNAGSRARAKTPKALRIGLQKNGVILVVRQLHAIERALEPLGVTVAWHEFAFGPPLLEALNAGAIDFGTTGEAPPIFAQAARANLYYVSAGPGGGAENAILVREDSGIKSVHGLKGKKVAVAKVSSGHSHLLAALEKAGVGFEEITPVYLAPADASAAFVSRFVDAWSIWDPFFAIAEAHQPVRIVARFRDTHPATAFFLANKDHADRYRISSAR